MRQLTLIAHNLRSTHNVGSLLRTADGLGVQRVYLTGYTPYPLHPGDGRLPHLATKLHDQISKTALGAETSQPWEQADAIEDIVAKLRAEHFQIIALEQSDNTTELPKFKPPEKLAIIIGREVEGLEPAVISLCDEVVEIPMLGQKESFNVVQAAAMALYHCRYMV